MSVLVEALSLIIPRTVLDVSFPGGTDAFMDRMCLDEVPSRRVCADDKLVSVSFSGAGEAEVVGKELLELGIVAVDDERFVELAFVDQLEGPTLRCDWLEWRRHRDGFTSCWLVGTDPSVMSAPADWTPEQSRNLIWHDYRDEPGRCLKLAQEGDLEIWLDFQSGDVMSAPLRKTPGQQTPESSPQTIETMSEGLFSGRSESFAQSGTLITTVRAVLDRLEYRYHQLDSDTIYLAIRDDDGAYALTFHTDDEREFVRLMGSYSYSVPPERRTAVAEAASRVNTDLAIGNFEIDFADGELRFRISLDVEEGLLSEKMGDNMLGFMIFTMGRYHRAFMRVAFSAVEPAAALAEVQ